MKRRVFLLGCGFVVLVALLAQAEIPDKGWGIGIQFNYPFTGFSIRWFHADGLGVEFNIFPNPSSRPVDLGETASGPDSPEKREVRRLELSLSAKVLLPVRRDGNVNYFFAGGPALTFVFEEAVAPLPGTDRPKIGSRLERAILSGMGAIEVEGIWLPRLAGTFEYGLTWDLLDPLNFSLLAGGIGAHYYI
jgi:hypothetical protein